MLDVSRSRVNQQIRATGPIYRERGVAGSSEMGLYSATSSSCSEQMSHGGPPY